MSQQETVPNSESSHDSFAYRFEASDLQQRRSRLTASTVWTMVCFQTATSSWIRSV